MTVCVGKLLYEMLYPPDPERYPRGRKPWRAVDREGQDHFQDVAESLLLEMLDAMGGAVNDDTPTIYVGEPAEYSIQDVGRWLQKWRDHLTETGELLEEATA